MTDLRAMFVRLSLFNDRSLLVELQVKPTWIDQIRNKQMGDKSLELRCCQVESGITLDLRINKDRVLCSRGRICVPNDEDLRQLILREAYSSPYVMHPSGNKMYRDLRDVYWWPGLKREVTDFMARCLTYQTNFSLQKLAKLYISEIVRLHGVLVSIISNRDPRFTSQFWKKLHKALETEDNVCLIRDRLKVASDKQESYVDLKRQEIEYSIGDFIFLKLELPPELDHIHDSFHVLMLRRHCSDPTHIIPIEEIEVHPDLTSEEESVQILDRDVKVLRMNSIPLVKVM
ncbi:uncharacterized protein [Gossypium hirsutum]|uniref:Integrase zinc-binding domain-containing protein n=1 Tax=Gossypium hirsutum TaxID=3635 RepID=A0A1U8IJH5_GOSHI|nr:uncharacterized protein LOC107895805 [Gossypium hirsutum]